MLCILLNNINNIQNLQKVDAKHYYNKFEIDFFRKNTHKVFQYFL